MRVVQITEGKKKKSLVIRNFCGALGGYFAKRKKKTPHSTSLQRTSFPISPKYNQNHFGKTLVCKLVNAEICRFLL